MSGWGVVADASAGLASPPPPGVAVAPLRVDIGGSLYTDGVDITSAEVYARLATGQMARTSTPSPGEFLEAILATGCPRVVVITMAAGLSAEHQAAVVAAGLATPSGIEVVVLDSGTAAAAYGLVVRAAMLTREGGASWDAGIARVREAIRQVALVGAIQDLHHLARSGRVPGIAAAAGSLLRVRPLFTLRDGAVQRRGFARGPGGARNALVAEARRLRKTEPLRPVWLAVLHAAADDEAVELRTALHASLPVARSEVVAFSPVLGAHTGPGVVGFALLPLRDEEVGVP